MMMGGCFLWPTPSFTLRRPGKNGIRVSSFRSEGGDVCIMSSSSKKNGESSGDKTLLYVAAGAAVVAVVGYFMFASGGDSKKSRNSKSKQLKSLRRTKSRAKRLNDLLAIRAKVAQLVV